MIENKNKGAILAIVSILSWGLMPVSAKGLTGVLDAYTLNFSRFLAAIIPLLLYLLIKNRKAIYQPLSKKTLVLILFAIAGLLTNHILFMLALKDIPAGTSQVIMQIGPLLLLISSVFLFKESFTHWQWLGVGLLLAGLAIFFNKDIVEIFKLRGAYGRGVMTMAFAASIWVIYGLAQKLLIKVMSPVIIMLCCYIGGGLILYPLADIDSLLALRGAEIILLFMCAFSSLFAYIAFAESMSYWEASKSSALLALIPLISIVFEMFFSRIFPTHIVFEALGRSALVGVLIVVSGTIIITIGGGIKPLVKKNKLE